MKKIKKTMMILTILTAMLTLGVYAYMQSPQFGALPAGERLARVQASPNYRDGAFHNLSETPQLTGGKSRLQVLYEFFFQQTPDLEPAQPVPSVKTDLAALPQEQDWYLWLGHASYLLNLDGKRYLIDPALVSATPLPFGGKPYAGADVYRPDDMPPIDYLVITHDHYDHLDYDTIRAIKNRVGTVITALGVGAHLERWGVPAEKIRELDWNDALQLDAQTRITALPARHFSGRTFRQNQTLWASFMLETATQSIYIGGDSGYDPFFQDIARRFPRITLAILENGQYNQSWANIHFLPDDLQRTIRDLKPERVLTVHNSKYTLARHPWYEPLERISAYAAREQIALLTPAIGEVFYLDARNPRFGKWWQNIRQPAAQATQVPSHGL